MDDGIFKLYQVSRILRVVFRFINIVPGKRSNAFKAVPGCNRPKMANAALEPTPDLNALISSYSLVIGHCPLGQETKVLIRIFSQRAAMPYTRYYLSDI